MEEEFSTTFWMDFTIADAFGLQAIQDTYNRAFNDWKSDYKYITDLVMVLNHKIWQWYEKNDEYAKLYDKLWWDTHEYAISTLKDDELRYYYEITD